MTIVFVIRALDVGGAERQCRDFAVELARRGFAVSICTLGAPGPLATGIEARGVKLISLGHRGVRDLLRTSLRLRRRVPDMNPSAIYSFLPVSNVICALALPRKWRRKLIWGMRSAALDRDKLGPTARVVLRLEQMFASRPALYVANSRAGALHHEQRGFDPTRMRIVENAIDTGTFRFDADERLVRRGKEGVGANRRVVVILGRIDPIKGHETFLAAALIVAKQDADVEFWSIGGGPASHIEALERAVPALVNPRRLRWFGEIHDRATLASLLMASDLAVSASLTEGFPNAVAECAACGLPVVGTDVGDTGRIIGSGGTVVNRADAEAMARAILAELRQSRDRAAIAMDFRTRFDAEGLFGRHERILAELGDVK